MKKIFCLIAVVMLVLPVFSGCKEEVTADPMRTAEELREIDKVDEKAIIEAEDRTGFVRLSTSHGLSEIPAEVFEAINLQTIELNGFTGKTLPEELLNLPNLAVLYISGANNIATLPDFIGDIENLVSFSIRNARELDLGAALKVLSRCPNLKYVQINNSRVESVIPAEIGNMKKLEILDIGQNTITEIADEFYTLPNLKRLGINSSPDNQYDYDTIFANLKRMPELARIVVYFSGLSGLPEILNEYPSLSTVQWREDGTGWPEGVDIQEEVAKWDAKFPDISISWSTGSSMFYDYVE